MDKAYLEITNRCNLACSFCHGTKRSPRILLPEEFELITDKLQGKVIYLYFHLMGEPLLHPHLGEFIAAAWKKGFKPMITTNGTLLSKCAETVLKKPPYKISISLHAPAANPASFGDSYFTGCINFAVRAAQKDVVTALRLWNLGAEEKTDNEKILELLHQRFPGEWHKIRDSFQLTEHLFLEWGKRFEWPDENAIPLPPDGKLFCRGLRDQIGILSDGTVVPCCLDAEGNLVLGNLLTQSLEEILNSPRAKSIYEGFTKHEPREELCRRCGFARRFL